MSITRTDDAFETISEALAELRAEIDDLETQLEVAELEAENKTVWVKIDGWGMEVDNNAAAAAYEFCHDIGINPERRYSLIQIEELRLAVERILR